MKDRHDSGLTVVGGRPNDEGPAASSMSPGFQTLLERLAGRATQGAGGSDAA